MDKQRYRVRVPWPRVITLTKDEGMDRGFENYGFSFQVMRTEKVIPDVDIGPEIYEC